MVAHVLTDAVALSVSGSGALLQLHIWSLGAEVCSDRGTSSLGHKGEPVSKSVCVCLCVSVKPQI